jgi:hypothetical protein
MLRVFVALALVAVALGASELAGKLAILKIENLIFQSSISLRYS